MEKEKMEAKKNEGLQASFTFQIQNCCGLRDTFADKIQFQHMRLLLGFFWLAVCLPGLWSCHSTQRFLHKTEKEMAASPVFSRAFTGFVLRDAHNGAVLMAQNPHRYFTPASNTKILTLYTCLNVLKDSLPGLEVMFDLLEKDLEDRASLIGHIVRGTGDPTMLHPKFEAWQAPFRFIQHNPVIILDDPRQFPQPRFGAGWSWDDYSDDYSVEMSPMPVYGNVVRAHREAFNIKMYPALFQDSIEWIPDWQKNQPGLRRVELANRFEAQIPDQFPKIYEVEIPVFQARQRLVPILADTVPGVYALDDYSWDGDPPQRVIYSTPVDTVYRRMMYESDNFVADQLLLMCAREKFGFMQHEAIIRWVQDSLFDQQWSRPRWLDGSGLSRYNLATPQFITEILLRMWREQDHERLFSLFPAGGQSGTIANWYRGADGRPYIFAKTGSMGGVHCLSGYLVAKSGRVLVFSFMHNNFVGSSAEWKKEMQRFLEKIYGAF